MDQRPCGASALSGQTKDVVGKAEKLTENSKERLEKSQAAIDEWIEQLIRRG
jgi:uncharacterized protein YjbJ (UPF0337 family)